jgi:tight adherence protein B
VLYLGILAALVATTLLAVAGIGQLAAASGERAAIRSRNALAEAERRDRKLLNRIDAALRRTEPGAWLATYLTGGGVTWTPTAFLALNAVAGAAAYVVVRSVMPTWVALPAAAGGVYAVWWYVERQRRQRRDKFIAQLPDVARLISNGSQAGLSLLSAIELAQNDLDEPAATELRRVASQIRLGQTLDGALAELTRRMPSRDVGVLVSTLVIQQRAGGDLVEALSDLALTLQSRRDTAREVKVMLIGAVFTSYVIPFLVVGLLLLLELTSPGALEDMVAGLLGRIVLIVAGAMTAIGFLIIRKTTRIEL